MTALGGILSEAYANPELVGLSNIVEGFWPPSVYGQLVRVPVRVDHERRAWNDAVAALEALEAARAEWPWPER